MWLQCKPKTCTLNSLESLWCVSAVHIYFCELYWICKADFCQEHQITERKIRKFVKEKKIHFGQWESLFQCKTWSVQIGLVFHNLYCTIFFIQNGMHNVWFWGVGFCLMNFVWLILWNIFYIIIIIYYYYYYLWDSIS